MITAFSGSTTEPVISQRTTKVSPARSMIASGSRDPIPSCWSMNAAASPPTRTGTGPDSARID